MDATKRSTGKNGNGAGRRVTLTVRPAGRGDLVPLSFFFDAVLRRDYFMRRGQLEELVSGRYHQVYNYSGATEVRAKLDMSSGDPRGFYRSLGFVSTGVRNDKGNVEVLRRPQPGAGNSRRVRLRPKRMTKCKRAEKGGVAATRHKSRK